MCTLHSSIHLRTPFTFSPLYPSRIPLSLSHSSLLNLRSAPFPSLPSLSSLPSPYPRFHGGHRRSAGEEEGNAAVLRVEEEAVEPSVDRSLTQTALHDPTMALLNCSVCSVCVSSPLWRCEGGVRGLRSKRTNGRKRTKIVITIKPRSRFD